MIDRTLGDLELASYGAGPNSTRRPAVQVPLLARDRKAPPSEPPTTPSPVPIDRVPDGRTLVR